MSRNLNRRVEALVRLDDPAPSNVHEILDRARRRQTRLDPRRRACGPSGAPAAIDTHARLQQLARGRANGQATESLLSGHPEIECGRRAVQCGAPSTDRSNSCWCAVGTTRTGPCPRAPTTGDPASLCPSRGRGRRSPLSRQSAVARHLHRRPRSIEGGGLLDNDRGRGAFVPNREVDAVGWFDLASARAILSYNDVVLVDEIETAIMSSTITP